ncbi:hypothetical protein RBB79_00185 [Tunturiibacter empetritectus]|uniref:Uncharacterized protein n=2 Tax=Tunturiibacter TaxID=3154218 RepID=A0A852VSF0_9BACT|nr:hypothetical protein [Edaphobacter lichenicola]NYF92242.1 hypothetical protein [Edaphobacter lichenicola]
MLPPKKAAKKAVKKAAKKPAGRHHDKHHQANDLRRAYEHMGRLEILRKSHKSLTADAVGELTKLAQKEIEGGHHKDAADLLRASEHLSFAALAGDSHGSTRISAELEQSITEHFDELTRRADEHWEGHTGQSSILDALYQSSRRSAVRAFKDRDYHQALEFARAAEALAHVKQGGPLKLERGHKDLQLKGA